MSPVSNDDWLRNRYGGGNALSYHGKSHTRRPRTPMHHFQAYNTRSAFETRLGTLANIIRTVGPVYDVHLTDYGFFGGLVRNPENQHKDCDCVFFFSQIDYERMWEFFNYFRKLKTKLEQNDPLFSFFDCFFTDGTKIYVFYNDGGSCGWAWSSYNVVPFLKHKRREFFIGNHSKRLTPQIDGNIRIDGMVESFRVGNN